MSLHHPTNAWANAMVSSQPPIPHVVIEQAQAQPDQSKVATPSFISPDEATAVAQAKKKAEKRSVRESSTLMDLFKDLRDYHIRADKV